jgi:hypothetical protein
VRSTAAGVLLLSLVTVIAASCAATPPAIPVGGSVAGVSALAGDWSGEYSSQATQRYGSIRFTLAVNSDTAFGDVSMQPRGPDPRAVSVGEGGAKTAPSPPPQQVLHIAFVRDMGDSVAGVLDPYQDPECKCTLHTRFSGRLRGDRITGSYATKNMETGAVTLGEWHVQRKAR